MELQCATCNKSCTNRCSRCAKVSYCSTVCQKSNWKEHKLDCFPVELRFCPETNQKSIYLTKTFAAGDMLWKEKPLVYGLFDTLHYDNYSSEIIYCEVCCKKLAPGEAALECKICRSYMCSEICNNAKIHRENECKPLGIRQKSGHRYFLGIHPSEFVILLRSLNLKKNNPKSWNDFMNLNEKPKHPMETNRSENECDFKDKKREEMKLDGTMELLGICEITGWTELEIKKVLSIIHWNSIEDYSNCFVKWICKYGSSFRHSCSPNVIWRVNKSQEVEFRASVDMQVGVEIRMSKDPYGIIDETSLRHTKLMDMRGIYCTCERCADPTELNSYVGGIKCDASGCRGCILPKLPNTKGAPWTWFCDTCGIARKQHEITLMNNVLQELQQTINENLHCKQLMVDGIVEVFKKGMYKFHQHNYQLEQLHESLMMHSNDFVVPAALTKQRTLAIGAGHHGEVEVTKYAKCIISSGFSLLVSKNPAFAPFTHRRGMVLVYVFCGLAYLYKYGKNNDWDEMGFYRRSKEEIKEIKDEAEKILNFYAVDTFLDKNRIAMMMRVYDAILK